MKSMIFAAALGLAAIAPAWAQDAAGAEYQLALEVQEVSGAVAVATSTFNNIMPQIEASLRQGYPDASDEQLAQAMGLYQNAFAQLGEQITVRSAQLYAERFTEAELRDMLAFYRTETGQKLAAELPEMTRLSMAAGEQMGMQVVTAIQPQVQAIMAGE